MSRTSQDRADLTPRQLRTALRSFRPTDAAFVFHLAQCQTCQALAKRLLPRTRIAKELNPLERDFVSTLACLEYFSFIGQTADEFASPKDLPPGELQRFLEGLDHKQSAFITHLVDCLRCQVATAEQLAPKPTDSSRHNEDVTHSEAAAL